MISMIKHYSINRPIALFMLALLFLGTASLSLAKTLNIHAEIPIFLEKSLGGDIYLHFTLALFITLVFIRVISATLSPIQSIFLAIVIVSTCCVIDESLQMLSSSRSFSLLDLGASLLGITMASIIYYVTSRLQSSNLCSKLRQPRA
ncbi:hypothetical protein EAY03_16335 [Vibrio anguillarum]|uniref:VanZ-like domain-containing protein n=1 Tax=Vibrio anguillarum TaxID=55601 RepID=A0A289GAP8_VIBAN|nr:hypothetical protein CK207_05000 [Vibrio anguillarum]AXN04426.1 hypothetical protein DD610_09170 [Vibrio anguillarum]AZS25719.1 hypothetical protein DYL72_12315 [Vibrio anguillarum]MBF4311406.1 hypothetical protein [Vibrio anguillarum]MBF4326096.1 hypothetical protein [Vibrio anguillarum]